MPGPIALEPIRQEVEQVPVHRLRNEFSVRPVSAWNSNPLRHLAETTTLSYPFKERSHLGLQPKSATYGGFKKRLRIDTVGDSEPGDHTPQMLAFRR